MKARAKKALVADKVERLKTGGGQFVTDVTDNIVGYRQSNFIILLVISCFY